MKKLALSLMMFLLPLAMKAQVAGIFSSVNTVVYSSPAYSSLNAAVAACPGGGCTVIINAPTSLSANLTLPASTTLQFAQPGALTTTGFTLTANGPIVAGPYRIFSGSGTVTLGAAVTQPPVEWFGAVGDWSGTSGSDNTTAVQTCLNALSAGQCILQSKSYAISSALSITRSNVGLRGQTRSVRSPTLYPTPNGSILISTSTTANLINVTGTSTSNTIVFNEFNDFTLERTTTASVLTARGMQINYTYGIVVDGVVSEDSPGGFYVHGSGSQGFGGFSNDVVAWGYGGFTETSGSYCGWCLDSADGTPNPSLRIRNSAVLSNLGTGVTTIGINSTGTSLEDLHVRNFETAGLSYGENVVTSVGALSALDIHFWDTINDSCQISCIFVGTTGAPASVEFTGGWNFRAGSNTAPVIDLEGESNVTLSNMDIYFPTTGPAVKINVGSNDTISNNQFIGSGTSSAVSANNATFITVSHNQMPNITATNVISFTSVLHGVISDNTISGTGTNGISLDAATHGIAGLPSNAISGTFTATVSDLGGNVQTESFSVAGCTTAGTTDSNCSGTITLPTAMRDTNYSPVLTVNATAFSGAGPFLSIEVAGALTTTTIPYNITCTFGCSVSTAATIYVTASHN